MPIIEDGLAAWSAVSAFTQQKPRSETVKVVKVAAIIGSGIATSTMCFAYGPAGYFLRAGLQVLIVRVVVISTNILFVGVQSYTENENFFYLVGKLSEKEEDLPFTVEVFSQGLGDYAWKVIKPTCIPDGTHELLVDNIKGFVKVPVAVVASYVGNCVHDLTLHEIGLSSRMNPITILREQSMKFTSLRVADYVDGCFEYGDKLLFLQVSIGASIYAMTRIAKNYLDNEEAPLQLEPPQIKVEAKDPDWEKKSSVPL